MLRCVRMSPMRYDPRGVLNFTGSAMNLSLERIGAIFHEAAVPIEIVDPFNYAWVECCAIHRHGSGRNRIIDASVTLMALT
jgi:hypothetical protein